MAAEQALQDPNAVKKEHGADGRESKEIGHKSRFELAQETYKKTARGRGVVHHNLR